MGFKSPSTSDFSHNLLSATHPDTTPAAAVAGDLIRGALGGGVWERYGIGTEGEVLTVQSGLPVWVHQPTILAQTYFLTDAASSIAGYKSMTVAIPGGVETSVSAAIAAAGDPIEEWATPAGFPSTTFIPAGVWHIHIHAQKTAGTKTVQVYAEVYKRTDPGGVETLLGTFEHTSNLTAAPAEYDIHTVIGDTILNLTDRIVVKFKGTPGGAGTNPTAALFYLSDDASRLDMPVSTSSLDHGTLLGLADDDHTQYALLAGRAGTNAFTGTLSSTVASGDNNLMVIENTNSGDSVKIGVVGGFSGVWMNQGTPDLTNFSFLGDASFSIFNATSDVYFGTGNTYCMHVYSNRGIGIGDTSGGTGGTSPGTNNLKVDGDINAITSLSVNGKAFSFGANDSAGAGFRTVKIANA